MIVLKRLWAFAARKNLVVLHDDDGNKTVVLEHMSFNGTKYAYRYRTLKERVVLNANGTTSGINFVRKWERL